MILLQLYPAYRPCPLDDVYADLHRKDTEGSRVLMNVVTTVDGKSALGGRSHGLGSAVDRALMRQLRAAADAVIVGAGTLRAELTSPGVPPTLAARRVRAGRPAQPLSVVLAGHEPPPLRGRMARLGPVGLVVFAPAAADVSALRGRATVYRADGERPDPRNVVSILRTEHDVRTVLIEGGPRVYASFLAAGAVDELMWTVAPALGGSPDAGMIRWPDGAAAGRTPLRLLAAYESGGELFLRYAVGGGDREDVGAASLGNGPST